MSACACRWTYFTNPESKSVRRRKVQLCGPERSRRGSQTHLPHCFRSDCFYDGFIAQCTLCVFPLIDADLPPPPVPPSIRDNSGDSPVVVNVLVGKSVTLECESNAVPPPVITWYKNGRVVTESANLRVLAEGQILQIKGSEVRDEWKPAMCLLD